MRQEKTNPTQHPPAIHSQLSSLAKISPSKTMLEGLKTCLNGPPQFAQPNDVGSAQHLSGHHEMLLALTGIFMLTPKP